MSRKFPILLYHRVGPRDGSYMDAYTVSPEAFRAQMEQLHRERWHPISIASALAGGDLPRRAVAITFDDGFASNREHAWPVLERFGFPADTFIVTGRLAQSNLWDRAEDAIWPLLSEEELASADNELMTFHSHTATHTQLTSIINDERALRKELDRSANDLSDTIPNWGSGFAYPFGTWNWRIRDKIQSFGYSWACSCLEGLNSARTNPFLLRRVSIDEADVGIRLRLKLITGRTLLKWPPERPAEISLAKAWLSKELAKHAIGIGRSRTRNGTADGVGRDLDSQPTG